MSKNLDNPLLIEVKMFLAEQSWIRQHRYSAPYRVCTHFSKDIVDAATRVAMRCGCAVVDFDAADSSHAIVAFDTDAGLVFIEPQDGEQQTVLIGKQYPSELLGVPREAPVKTVQVYWNDDPCCLWISCNECGYVLPTKQSLRNCIQCGCADVKVTRLCVDITNEEEKKMDNNQIEYSNEQNNKYLSIRQDEDKYDAEISRVNPSCIIFLVDQSRSMQSRWAGEKSSASKAELLATMINKQLLDLLLRCTKPDEDDPEDENAVRNYFSIGMIGYGASVGSAWSGNLSDRILVPIRELRDNFIRLETIPMSSDNSSTKPRKMPIWIEPRADNGTPMCGALSLCRSVLLDWIAERKDKKVYPPIVLNFTDGEVDDGDPTSIAEDLMQLGTQDGHLLLFNLQITSGKDKPVLFPSTEQFLYDKFARMLFRMSSKLPMKTIDLAKKDKHQYISTESRGFVLNARLNDAVDYIEVGTRGARNKMVSIT